MNEQQERTLKLVKDRDELTRRIGGSLAELYKAMKVQSFYPKGHPLRSESLQRARQALIPLLGDEGQSFAVSRGGFSIADGGAIENGPMVAPFAAELFIRRVQRITFLPDLSIDDLQSFLALLLADPRHVQSAGGMEELMRRQKIKTVWVNELDISAILAKRADLDEGGSGELEDSGNPAEGGDTGETPLPETPETEIGEIVALMDNEFEDSRYMQLSELLAAKAETLKGIGRMEPLLPALYSMMHHSRQEMRSQAQRESALLTMEQTAAGGMIDFLLSTIEKKEYKRREELYALLALMGEQIVPPILDRLCASGNLYARKALAAALVQIGEPAVPFITTMTKDSRWYVVRNMVAILGEIGGADCIKTLKSSAYHDDNRVRKEAIRSLSKIGGAEAEAVLLGLLTTKDMDVKLQAILSMGIMKSTLALQPLMDIIRERDFFCDATPAKREAFQAIGRIGDRRAAPFLIAFLKKRRWFTWRSLESVMVAAALALGNIGDESAIDTLKELSRSGGTVGAACKEALETMERVTE